MISISTQMEQILQPVLFREDEYLEEESKLVYCSKCRTPRKKRLEVLGKIYEPRCRCACQQAAYEQQERERKQREFLDLVSKNRSEKAAILARFDRTEDKEMKEVKTWAKQQAKTVQNLKAKENHCEEEFDENRSYEKTEDN